LFEIRSCVPKKCLEQVHSLLVEMASTLSKAPTLGKRIVGKDISNWRVMGARGRVYLI
jgi:hypothetical protein